LAASLRDDSRILLESFFILVTKYGNFCAIFSEKPFVAFAAISFFFFLFSVVAVQKNSKKKKIDSQIIFKICFGSLIKQSAQVMRKNPVCKHLLHIDLLLCSR
jgi:hypothetical protein